MPPINLSAIRQATTADRPDLAQLFYQTVMQNGPQHYSEAQTQAWAKTALDPRFAQLLAEATTFVIEADGEILGFAGLAADGHVAAIYVRCDLLGQGIGSRLMETLLTHAENHNMGRLYAEASEFSLGLFLKFGFRQLAIESVERQGVEFQRYLVEKWCR
jgi:putative acetyltransferase